MVTGSLVDKDVLCNAWELSLSWEQVAETQPVTDRTAELKVGGYFVDLEAERDSYRERCKELESRLDLYYGNAYDVVVDENAKLIARVAELEAQHRWISVKDRLPERQGTTYLNARYLVLYHGYYHDINVFSPSNKKWLCGEVDKTEHVTHWMDIPDLPEEV